MLRISNSDLVDSKIKAKESDRLKSTFVANMSHETRTPLNGILGFVNILKRDENLADTERKEYLGFIESGAKRLLRIITDVLDISKIESKQLSIDNELCNLNQIIDGLHGQFAVQIDESLIELISIKAFANENSNLILDSTRLAQILSNLIENALKFTQNGRVEFGYTEEDSFLKFFVKDTGIGLDLDV